MKLLSARFSVTDIKGGNDGSQLYQYLATLSGSLIIICSGMHYGWPSPSLPRLLAEDSPVVMTNNDGSWIAVMPSIGAIVGSIVDIYILDKIGRKLSVMITAPFYFISWIMIATSPSILVFLIARFLAGLCDGISLAGFTIYVGEIANAKIRGLLGSCVPISVLLGYLLINIIGSYSDITTAAFISSVVPVVNFVTFFFMPESPYFLIMKNQPKDARRSLQIFHGVHDVDLELNRLTDAVKTDLENRKSFWELFTVSNNRRSLIIAIILRSAQQFSGTNAINFYAQTIFYETDKNMSSSLITIGYFSLQLITAILSSLLVDKLGRKPLLISSIIASALCLATEGLYFYIDGYTNLETSKYTYIPIVALFAYVVVFNLGMGTTPGVILCEIFPTSFKALALSVADIYFGFTVAVTSKLFQIMKDDLGMHVPFFVFTAICFIGLFFIVVYVPETKGKTLEEIQERLKRQRSQVSEENTL